MKRVVLYIDSRSLNDATSYYINIVKRAANNLGYDFLISESINAIKFNDILFTITTKNYVKGMLFRPFCKTIFWSQGVDPEESLLRDNNYLKYYIKSLIELISLRHFGFKFFVSKAMLNHYKKKYSYNNLNHLIMPCYNLNGKHIHNVNLSKYKHPSFVYAGSLSIWQNIDEILQVYKYIEKKVHNSSLTLLTQENEKAKALVKKYNIKHSFIKYVDLENLHKELLKHKYGFLLRKNILVNNVATPTKMNSYLACGLVPIFTDAINDYSDKVNLKGYNLKIKSCKSIEEIANKIIDFENSQKNFASLNIEIKKLFHDYYNDDKYIEKIQLKLKNYLS